MSKSVFNRKITEKGSNIDSVRKHLDEILEILKPFSPEVKTKSIGPDKGWYEVKIGNIKIDCSFSYGLSRTMIIYEKSSNNVDGIHDALKEFYS